RTIRATTADPVTLTTMLYDGALKGIRRARLFNGQGERGRFLDEIERAHLILGELLVTLDHDRGGDLARNLADVYVYAMGCLVQATLGEASQLDEAEKHVGRIALAWKTATAQLRAEDALPRGQSAAA
ncbi:MAG: flagellar export chaperone FliS, partial [Dehalococcoidia bacterium]|nr:flagellar export chaperone FliS [Dehalococcoidia bacterium]